MQDQFIPSARDLSGIPCLIHLFPLSEISLAKQGVATVQALWPLEQVSALFMGVDCASDHCLVVVRVHVEGAAR